MKNYRNLNCLTLLILLFTQCKDKEEPIPQYCIDFPLTCIDCAETPELCVDMEKIKDHYYFKTGSWWVYQEVNSHQLDTQWVSEDWVNDCNFDLTIKSSLDDYRRHRWTHLRALSKNCGMSPRGNIASIERSKGKGGDFIGTSYMGIFYPIVGDSTLNFGGGGYPSESYFSRLRVKNVYTNYNILNAQYTNVIEISDDYNMVEHSQPTTHFYAEHVGLIRKELIDSNQVWLLIDYNVEQ